MSKSRQKSGSELEYLRGENRKLKSLVRHLKKENRRLSKKEHIFDDHQITDNEYVPNTHLDECPNCKDGVLVLTDWVHVRMKICNNCTYKVKVNGKKEKTD